MSTSYNQLKNTYQYGIFQNLDYGDGTQNATAYFQRNLIVNGFCVINNGIKVSITDGAITTEYILTPQMIYYLTSISGDITTLFNQKANLTGCTFTGDVIGLTQSSTDNSTKFATTEYVKTQINNLINGAPTTLDTLNEIAIQLNANINNINILLNYASTANTWLAIQTYSYNSIFNAPINVNSTANITGLLTLGGGINNGTNTITNAQLGYLSNLTSDVQTALNSKTTLSAVQSNSNVWSNNNSFNTYLPTSTLTPTTSAQLITKSYGDASYAPLSNSYTTLSAVQSNANTFSNINTFSTTNTFNGLVNISNLIANKFSPTSLTITDNFR